MIALDLLCEIHRPSEGRWVWKAFFEHRTLTFILMKYVACLFLLLPFFAIAQTDPPMRIEKSEAKEMTNSNDVPVGSTQVRWSFIGTHDQAATIPECDSIALGSSDRCTAEAILESIRTNLTYDPAEANAPNEQDTDVEINFTVNEYGEVKSIKVDYSGDPRISQSIIQALYALPRFTPAQKGGASVGSKVVVAYPYSAIFQ